MTEKTIDIISDSISRQRLEELALARFGDMVKAVVDVEKGIMAVGGELHADEEALLIEQGSKQENLWGINIYINEPMPQAIEFDSMINLRPAQNNRTRGVEDASLRKIIIEIVTKLIKD
jgi:hypothetical protein